MSPVFGEHSITIASAAAPAIVGAVNLPGCAAIEFIPAELVSCLFLRCEPWAPPHADQTALLPPLALPEADEAGRTGLVWSRIWALPPAACVCPAPHSTPDGADPGGLFGSLGNLCPLLWGCRAAPKAPAAGRALSLQVHAGPPFTPVTRPDGRPGCRQGTGWLEGRRVQERAGVQGETARKNRVGGVDPAHFKMSLHVNLGVRWQLI